MGSAFNVRPWRILTMGSVFNVRLWLIQTMGSVFRVRPWLIQTMGSVFRVRPWPKSSEDGDQRLGERGGARRGPADRSLDTWVNGIPFIDGEFVDPASAMAINVWVEQQ